jgi:hypothetical protein
MLYAPTKSQLDAGFKLMRAKANDSGFGHFVSDDKLHAFVSEFATAILNAPPEAKSPA